MEEPGIYDLLTGIRRSTYYDMRFLDHHNNFHKNTHQFPSTDYQPQAFQPGQTLGKYIRNPQFSYDFKVVLKGHSKLDANVIHTSALSAKFKKKSLSQNRNSNGSIR